MGDTYVDQVGIEVFAVHDGHDLDQYLFRSSSPLDFVINLERDYGPVDADWHPAPDNALFGRQARLTLRAWDVDETYPVTDVEPEVDLVRIKGVQIDGTRCGLLRPRSAFGGRQQQDSAQGFNGKSAGRSKSSSLNTDPTSGA